MDVLCVADADIEVEAIARSLTHKYGIRLNPVKVKSIRDIEMDNRAFYEDVVEYGYVIKGISMNRFTGENDGEKCTMV